MVDCHRSRLPLALRLQHRSTLAGFAVNTVSAAMLALYGVSCGTVVAGHVGAESRFEYEAERWALDCEVTLRGRECPTRIAVPATRRPAARSRARAGRA